MGKSSKPLTSSFRADIAVKILVFLLMPIAVIVFFYVLQDSRENYGVFFWSAEYYRFVIWIYWACYLVFFVFLLCLFDIRLFPKSSDDDDAFFERIVMLAFSGAVSFVGGFILLIFVAQFIPHVVTAFSGESGSAEYTIYNIDNYRPRGRIGADKLDDVIFSVETAVPPFDNFSFYGKREWAVIEEGDVVVLTGKKSYFGIIPDYPTDFVIPPE
ncbi:MAG: hypothetical protein AB8G95_14625 [Anaerolineae bacterium]